VLQPYIPILLLLVFVVANAVLILGLSHVLQTYRPTQVKAAAYESGMPGLGDARERFSVKFYLVAMLFIVFDIETVFLYPWAVAYADLKVFGLVEMVVFIAILLGAYAYVWKRGALDWAE
jgi:NADH-quinone oxidoreductase subunit A